MKKEECRRGEASKLQDPEKHQIPNERSSVTVIVSIRNRESVQPSRRDLLFDRTVPDVKTPGYSQDVPPGLGKRSK